MALVAEEEAVTMMCRSPPAPPHPVRPTPRAAASRPSPATSTADSLDGVCPNRARFWAQIIDDLLTRPPPLVYSYVPVLQAVRHGTYGTAVMQVMCEGCAKTPSFGLPAEGRRRWCGTCATAHHGAVSLQVRKTWSCLLLPASRP
jgi:hypothetical protein